MNQVTNGHKGRNHWSFLLIASMVFCITGIHSFGASRGRAPVPAPAPAPAPTPTPVSITVPKFYYQTAWGTPSLQLLRTATGSLAVQSTQTGYYEFYDDAAYEGVTTLSATWKGISGTIVTPYITDEQGARWGGGSAVEGSATWSIQNFYGYGGGSGGIAQAHPSNIMSLSWQVYFTNTTSQPQLISCTLQTSSGATYTLFADSTTLPPLYTPMTVQNTDIPLANSTVPRVIIADSSALFSRPDWISAWPTWANKQFPGQFGYDLNGYMFASQGSVVRSYRQGGSSFTMLESHISDTGRTAWLMNNNNYATRRDAFSPDQSTWSSTDINNYGMCIYGGLAADTTQEAVYQAAQDRMTGAFNIGYDSFMIIDYVWPYFADDWGYGANAVATWKSYLNGTGRTLDLVNPTETWTFANYWAAFHSTPLTPASFGWTTWNDFVCGDWVDANTGDPIQILRYKLFFALWHFHHLVFLDRLGLQTNGHELAVSINPDSVCNGSDTMLMSRLAHLNSVGHEFFGSPSQTSAYRHTLSSLRYRTGGAALDLVGEVNSGGYGDSRYDRNVAYAFYYDTTAGALPRHYNVQYLDSALWTNPSTLGADDLTRFDHWFAGANAFLLRHQEEATTPPTRPTVTVVASRSVQEWVNGSTATLTQTNNVASYLAALNIDFEQVGRDGWNGTTDTHTNVLFFTPAIATPTQLTQVKNWIASGSGRTLVVVGQTPWRGDVTYPDTTLFPAPTTVSNVNFKIGTSTLSAPSYSVNVSGKTTVLADDNKVALIYKWTQGNNTIIEVTPDLPYQSVNPLGVTIMAKVLSTIGITPSASYASDWSLHTYTVPGGNALVAWKNSVIATQDSANYYSETAISPTTLTLLAKPSTAYTVNFLFEGKTQTVTSDASGNLNITASNTPEVVYYGVASTAFTQTLANAATTYKAVVNRTR